VDFNYEVSRSLAACDGAILVVDAAQGIEAQTLANVYLALDHDLDVFPVINKIDLPSAQPQVVIDEIEDVIGLEAQDAPLISAKNGINIEEVLEQVVSKIPAPQGDENAPLQALIFDSLYDAYKGVIIFCRIKNGIVKKGTPIRMMATGATAEVVEVGYFGAGRFIPCDELSAGMVGYITASIKNVKDTRVGDTVTDDSNPCSEPLPGYKKVNPMVYCGLYPADGAKYGDLRDALEKLQLNDASLQYEPETSIALGFGFRCGFLGLLHLEIIQERLEREYNLDLVTTAPGVIYKVHKTDGEVIELTNPSNLPDPSCIDYMEEPIVSAEIMVTNEFIGSIMKLCQERRGVYLGMEYVEGSRAILKYELPLNEIIYDFFDALKSRSRGYASFDYELKGYQRSKLCKLDIVINREEVDALSFIVHADSAYERGRKMCEKLKDEIPRHLFEIPIQAAVGGKIIARETVKALRKDVLAKCYGGDISRKKKLLEKQKEGKKRMRQIGNVEIPQQAFMSVLKLDDDK
jgi:GTP-binding protein LepA